MSYEIKRKGKTRAGSTWHIIDESSDYGGHTPLSYCSQLIPRNSINPIPIGAETMNLCQNCMSRINRLKSEDKKIKAPPSGWKEIKEEDLTLKPSEIDVEKRLDVTIYLNEESERSEVYALAGTLRKCADWLDEQESEISSVIIQLN